MTKLSMSEEEMLKRKYTSPYEERIAELEKWLSETSDEKLKLQMLRVDLVSKIGNQEKRIAELEHQLTHRNCLDCSNHSSNLRMRNLELEKENAELKAGGPKWYTPDEKLPEECTTVVAYGFDDIEPTTYHFVCSDQWEWLPRRIAVLSNEQIKKWCNIPMK